MELSTAAVSQLPLKQAMAAQLTASNHQCRARPVLMFYCTPLRLVCMPVAGFAKASCLSKVRQEQGFTHRQHSELVPRQAPPEQHLPIVWQQRCSLIEVCHSSLRYARRHVSNWNVRGWPMRLMPRTCLCYCSGHG